MLNLSALRSSQLLRLLAHVARRECRGHACAYGKQCAQATDLWAHVSLCRASKCSHPYCLVTKAIIFHWNICGDRWTCKFCKELDSDLKKQASFGVIINILEDAPFQRVQLGPLFRSTCSKL